MATELDGVGITPEILMEMYKEVRRGGVEEGTQAEEWFLDLLWTKLKS